MDRIEHDAALPPEAREELSQALRKIRAGGGSLARLAGSLVRVAGVAAAPLTSLAARVVGRQSPSAAAGVQSAIEAALARALDVATIGIAETAPYATPGRARAAAIVSGALGGAAGLPGFVPDAAFTTLLILRNIAALAREHGEDLADEDTRRACLEVFAVGAPSGSRAGSGTFAVEEGYWGVRLLLQGRSIAAMISQAAARFGVVLSEKMALQAVPVLGAAGGALINAAFLDHYRALADGHFTIRSLERRFGIAAVRSAANAAS